jgi:hypothetical protein
MEGEKTIFFLPSNTIKSDLISGCLLPTRVCKLRELPSNRLQKHSNGMILSRAPLLYWRRVCRVATHPPACQMPNDGAVTESTLVVIKVIASRRLYLSRIELFDPQHALSGDCAVMKLNRSLSPRRVSFAAKRELVDFRACFLPTGQLWETSLGLRF